MIRFARHLVAVLVAAPALLLVGSTAALARVAPPDTGYSDTGYSVPAPPASTSITFADRVPWMATGALIVLAGIAAYVTLVALVHRHQRTARQLSTS
jgi:hypothetical protein